MSDHRRPHNPQQHHSNRLPTIAELLNAARGGWLAILIAAGMDARWLDGKGHPCPRCGGRNRFAAFADVAVRGSVHCRICFNATMDPKPGDGLATLRWWLRCDTAAACRWLAGQLQMGPIIDVASSPTITRTMTLDAADELDATMAELAVRYQEAMTPAMLVTLANQLRFRVDVLERLRVGFNASCDASSWPMVDDVGRVVGIRLRSLATGEKWSERGGKNGLFVPNGLPESVDRLFIAEGPTDCGALLSLGLPAIGRPSCGAAVAMTCNAIKRMHLSECVIVADDDANGAGKRGAESLACVLVTVCRSVRIVYPPDGFNDVRDWIVDGATSDDVGRLVDGAAVRSLSIQWRDNH